MKSVHYVTHREYNYFKTKGLKTEYELQSRTAWVRVLASPLNSQCDSGYVTFLCLSFLHSKMAIIIVATSWN